MLINNIEAFFFYYYNYVNAVTIGLMGRIIVKKDLTLVFKK